MTMRTFFLVMVALGCTMTAWADKVILAENGQARADIIIPKETKPIVKLAAKELADYLARMTGATFDITQQPTKNVSIYLGFGNASDFAKDEFVIDVQRTRLDIYGRDTPRPVNMFNYYYDNPDKGTLYGVYQFLDTLGVRWLAPGTGNDAVPRRPTLEVKTGTTRFKPTFQDRQTSGGWDFLIRLPDAKEYVKNVNEVYLWGMRNRISTRGMVSGCHSENALKLYLNQERLNQPESQQLTKDGKRNPKYSCWSHPLNKKLWLQAIDGYFTGKSPKECGFDLPAYQDSSWPWPFMSPDEFMIDPMDHYVGNDGRCYCRTCQDFRQKHPCDDDTELIWKFIIDIADHVQRNYPGKYISTLVYPPKTHLPKLWKRPSNVRVRICLPGAKNILHPHLLDLDLQRLKTWGDYLGPKNIPLWTYQCAIHGRTLPGVPEVYPRMMNSYIHKVMPLCAGMFNELHTPSYTYRQLDVYIFLRLIWDPSLDVEHEIADFFKLYYGPVSADAQVLFDLFEQKWIQLDTLLRGTQPQKQGTLGLAGKNRQDMQKTMWGKVYTQEVMADIETRIATMERKTAGSPQHAKRVRLLRQYLLDIMKMERSEVMDKADRQAKLKLNVRPFTGTGLPSEEDWKRTPSHSLISAQRMQPKLEANGTFKLLASQDMLFIRAELQEPLISDSRTSHKHASGNTSIWQDNCIELFLYSVKREKFWHLMVNDNNAWSSQTNVKVLRQWTQMKGAHITSSKTPTGWSATLALPMTELQTDRTDLRFNLCRERNVAKKKTEFSTWSPLAMLGNWHGYENYGNLVFD